ncbi:AtpZ/AtpI family protein [uncultured Nocardioides sp.]|jgi:F0F1-type ATP synthase assembly protein I|uniref:AtpZ/AtpI family protein n=1 Tax=Nocardioides sp. TaxID=35761 RepID=UPI00261D35FD|nr:AtpZ/AtpI family protein [uncultured Nocardioides sp.]MCK5927431.1 AtpZ/AtpI family protein [Nocardioides sp.]|tara:strand:- start:276 stop:539 length:264 start_codon:yes stop_codon:yes gene_type:complete
MAPHDTSSDRTVEPSPDPWQAFGSLGAGVLLYGGAGWLADRWLETGFLLPLGLVLGAVLGFYTVIKRFGGSPAGTAQDSTTQTQDRP